MHPRHPNPPMPPPYIPFHPTHHLELAPGALDSFHWSIVQAFLLIAAIIGVGCILRYAYPVHRSKQDRRNS